MSEGVDLFGLYNTVTDWQAVRNSGIEFAWIKLSDGNTNRDDYGYVAKGKAVGIVMGGYHYAQPGDPVAQANRLVDQCSAYGALELAPALDLESPFVPGPAAVDFAVRFLNQLKARGQVPVLYANNSMLTGILGAVKAAVPDVKVWGAGYGAPLTVPHDVHQFTSTGSVPGIQGNVDRNTGSILRNTPGVTPGAPTANPEENHMLAKASNDDYITVPCDGKQLMFVASAFGRTVDMTEVYAIPDTGGRIVPMGHLVAESDRPGPFKVPPGTRAVSIRYNANHDFTVWCA